MQNLMKFWLLFVLLAGCAQPREEPPPQSAKAPQPPPREGLPAPDLSKELSENKARELITQAASISKREFQEILTHPPVRLGEIKNQSLTALLLAVDPLHAREQNPNVFGDFRYLAVGGRLPDPEMIQTALLGENPSEFVSLIQPEHITKCTCLNRGDTAHGRVEYRAPNTYAGSADFTAHRQGDQWEIVAFHLPEYRLLTKRQPDGTWRLDSEEQLLGVALP